MNTKSTQEKMQSLPDSPALTNAKKRIEELEKEIIALKIQNKQSYDMWLSSQEHVAELEAKIESMKKGN